MWMRLMNAFRSKPVLVESSCSSCGERLDEHAQADIGSAVLDTAEDAELRRLIDGRQWDAAVKYQAANATADIRAWRVIRCEDQRIAVVARLMPIEMWNDDRYEKPQFLSSDDASELMRLVQLPERPKT